MRPSQEGRKGRPAPGRRKTREISQAWRADRLTDRAQAELAGALAVTHRGAWYTLAAMPRTRKPQPAPQAGTYEVPLDAPPTAEQLLAEFFGEAHADDILCSLYELGGVDRRERGYLYTFPFSGELLVHELYEDLLGKYGAGWYELIAQERQTRKFVKRMVFQVGTERDRRRKLLPDRQPAAATESPRPELAATPAPASAIAGTELAMLSAILDNQQRMLERLLEQQAAPRERERDFLSTARDLAELKNLFGGGQSTPVADIFGLVKDVLRLKDELSDGDGSSNPLALAFKQLAPVISRAVDQLSTQQAPTHRPARSMNPAAPAAPANGNANEGFAMDLGGVFAELQTYAERGASPADTADAILEFLANKPAWLEHAVLGMVLDEGERVVGRVVGSYPRLEPHRDWLGRVVLELLAKTDDEGAAGTDATAAEGERAGAGAA